MGLEPQRCGYHHALLTGRTYGFVHCDCSLLHLALNKTGLFVKSVGPCRVREVSARKRLLNLVPALALSPLILIATSYVGDQRL